MKLGALTILILSVVCTVSGQTDFYNERDFKALDNLSSGAERNAEAARRRELIRRRSNNQLIEISIKADPAKIGALFENALKAGGYGIRNGGYNRITFFPKTVYQASNRENPAGDSDAVYGSAALLTEEKKVTVSVAIRLRPGIAGQPNSEETARFKKRQAEIKTILQNIKREAEQEARRAAP